MSISAPIAVHEHAVHVGLSPHPTRHTAYPRVVQLQDGRLAVGVAADVACDYFVGGEWLVLVSDDSGTSWTLSSDPAIPLNWPGSSTRECHDRATRVLPDGTWWATGVVGWQAWHAAEATRARAEGRFVAPTPPPAHPGHVGVGTRTVFVQKSHDAGRTWTRRDIELPPAGWTLGLHRDVTMDDGTVVLPVRQRSSDGTRGHVLVMRVKPGEPDSLRLFPVPRDLDGVTGSEAAIARVGGDRLVMLLRADDIRGGDGHMLCSWSDDAGCTWSFPTSTPIWGRPPHLLSLGDGRLLATYGHQRPPFGVMAVLSEDGGLSWDVQRRALIAIDPARQSNEIVEGRPVGYHPMTIELDDGDLFTCYYIQTGAGPRARGVRWHLPW